MLKTSSIKWVKLRKSKIKVNGDRKGKLDSRNEVGSSKIRDDEVAKKKNH